MAKLDRSELALLGRALGHPLRVQILVALLDEPEMSPGELAHALGKPLANVSYHVRYLVGLKVLKLERTVPRRGAIQHFYSLEKAAREAFSGDLLPPGDYR